MLENPSLPRSQNHAGTCAGEIDGIDRLNLESVTGDPANVNGSVSYVLDPVGNRTSQTSSLSPLGSPSNTFDADDQPQDETYDSIGDTISTGGQSYAYNSWLKLVSMNGGQVALRYDGLGQLVAKTAGGVTTQYLVDDLSLTGYPQVVEELVNGAVARTYTYGYERISQSQTLTGAWTPSFYIYDGRGTVRMLASLAGSVTDTYDYDAFGNMLVKTGATPNVYLYRGERYDPDLKLYYLRARWYNPVTGRFMTRDPYAGSAYDPASLHRYNYARSNPANFLDPSGRFTVGEYGLMFTNQVGKNLAIAAVGETVRCMLRADAGMLFLVGEFSRSNDTVIDAKANFQTCAASVTVGQLLNDALFSWAAGYAFEELGGMLQEWLEGGGCCFAAGTPVQTDHGAVPIERIRVGDKVWSLNRTTGKQELKTVTALTAQHRNRLIELRIEGEAEPLRPSLDHPFWVKRASAGHEAWIEAGTMLVGDLVLDRGGNWRKVLAVKPIEGLQTVYNFEVDGDHDYYVGKSGVLVHNALLCNLKYKPGWTAEQNAAADAKLAAYKDSNLVKSPVVRSGTSAARRFAAAGNDIPPGSDVDHIIDLQLGGTDTISNMQTLDSSVNRSLGRQIQQAIQDLDIGTVIDGVTIGVR